MLMESTAALRCGKMQRVRQLAGGSGNYVYSAAVPAALARADYTARVIAEVSQFGAHL